METIEPDTGPEACPPEENEPHPLHDAALTAQVQRAVQLLRKAAAVEAARNVRAIAGAGIVVCATAVFGIAFWVIFCMLIAWGIHTSGGTFYQVALMLATLQVAVGIALYVAWRLCLRNTGFPVTRTLIIRLQEAFLP